MVSVKSVPSRGRSLELGTTLGSFDICGWANDSDVGCDVTVD